MDPVRRLFRKGSLYTLGTGVQLAASAAVLPIVTRLLAPTEYGVVALVLSINVVVTALVGLGIPAAITREYFTEPDTGRVRARALIGSLGLSATAGVMALLLTIPVWGDWLLEGSPAPLVIGVVTAVPASIAGGAASLLLVEERPVSYVAVVLAGSLGAQVLGITAILLAAPQATSYLTGYLVATIFAAALGLLLSGSIRVRFSSRVVFRRALAIGLPTVPHSLAIYLLALGDRLVIQAISGLAAVGRYQVAYALGSLGLALLSALQNAWVPITFSASDQERWVMLARITTIVIHLAVLAAVALTTVGPIALDIIAPSAYDPDDLLSVTALVAASAIPWAFYLPMSQVLFWERRTRPLAWITPTSAVFNLVLVACLTPPLGLEGAALSTLAALILQALLCYRAVTQVAVIPWVFRGVIAPIVIGAVAIAAFAVLPDQSGWLGLRLIVTTFLVIVGFRLIHREIGPSRDKAWMVERSGRIPV